MRKEFVIKIGKLYIKRSYQGCRQGYLGLSFTSDVNEAKRFYEDELIQDTNNTGVEYANFVADQLGGQVYEVQTSIKLAKF
ncbi:TPA: hypothetical protein ACGXX3_000695 [Enterococcus faecium]|uniref:hypothetical protein n=1 Tax=Enterococcus TaxID=1350 RepID=UPI00032F7CCC|nr:MULTISPECIES: hypothetical protein [Enterococcus]EGO9257505.1 hypothetical protein [Enterococcus faecalis]EHG5989894.1 hypothetical protein [Enterococcus faecalis]EJI7153826.1 hypothetical protein [Enterococcus faecalis]EKZ0361366.1 hypothetical protein [Enterococcus faecalis]ELU9027650.1 hypothetical protein [Enterococcus faecalis]